MSHRVVGIVLAGGRARRFGSDKLAANLRGRPLLHHAIDAVGDVVDHVIVVLAPDGAVPAMPDSVEGRATVARDMLVGSGPLAGVAAAARAMGSKRAGEGPDVALVVGGDMPEMDGRVLRLLVDRLVRDTSLAALTLAAPDPAPLPMVLRSGFGPVAESLLASGRRGLRDLLVELEAGRVPDIEWRALDPDGRTLRDVDRPADL